MFNPHFQELFLNQEYLHSRQKISFPLFYPLKVEISRFFQIRRFEFYHSGSSVPLNCLPIGSILNPLTLEVFHNGFFANFVKTQIFFEVH